MSTTDSRLLRLPAELRLLIYDFVYQNQKVKERNNLNLLLVCRRIYEDLDHGISALKKAKFLLKDTHKPEPNVNILPSRLKATISSLDIAIPQMLSISDAPLKTTFNAYNIIQNLPNLKSVTVRRGADRKVAPRFRLDVLHLLGLHERVFEFGMENKPLSWKYRLLCRPSNPDSTFELEIST